MGMKFSQEKPLKQKKKYPYYLFEFLFAKILIPKAL